jgi:DNA-binding SARP family transcriptional activator
MNESNLERRVNITTVDNPFDPFDDFDHWFQFDTEKGYYTSSKLARLTNLRNDMSEAEEAKEIERAIDRLIEIDPFDMYIKVTRNDDKEGRGES